MDMNKIRALIDRWLAQPRDPDRPIDPHAFVREPRRWSPNGRSGAVAVEEPDEPVLTRVRRGRPTTV